jgi:tRNA(fMet)-specific endonuclease VapC
VADFSLLDTDTLSEIMRGRDSNIVQKAREYLRTHGQFRISIITRYEILRGLKAKQASRQITLFEERCRKSILYPLIDDIIVKASDIYAYLYKQGLLISDADILIASTALVNNLTLITGNLEHFNRIPNLVSQSWK